TLRFGFSILRREKETKANRLRSFLPNWPLVLLRLASPKPTPSTPTNHKKRENYDADIDDYLCVGAIQFVSGVVEFAPDRCYHRHYDIHRDLISSRVNLPFATSITSAASTLVLSTSTKN